MTALAIAATLGILVLAIVGEATERSASLEAVCAAGIIGALIVLAVLIPRVLLGRDD